VEYQTDADENRIVLGIKAKTPGAATVQISPRLNGLTWARGTTATARGPVSVSWKLAGEKLEVQYSAPPGVQVAFRRNETHERLEVVVNGKKYE